MEDMRKFNETVKGALVGSDTKKVVNAAAEGNGEEYEEAVNSYSWPRTRDYTMVLLIFSPLVCAMQIVDNMNEDDESDDTVKKFEKLAPLVDNILTRQYMLDLCKYIGEGNGKKIKETLKNLSMYKDLLKALGIKDNVITKLIERAGKITRWVRNKEYIEKYVIPFVRVCMGSKFEAQITRGLIHGSDVEKKRSDVYDPSWYDVYHRDGDDKYPELEHIVWDLNIGFPNKEDEDYQTLYSAAREHRSVHGERQPDRIKVTKSLRDFFAYFGQSPIEKKALYTTVEDLYAKFKKVIPKIKTKEQLDIFDNYYSYYYRAALYKSYPLIRYDGSRLLSEDAYLSKILYMKYVMDDLNYPKDRNVDFNKLEKIIMLLLDVDPDKLEKARRNFKKAYNCDSWYYEFIKRQARSKMAREILREKIQNGNFSASYYGNIDQLEKLLSFVNEKELEDKKAARQRRNSIS